MNDEASPLVAHLTELRRRLLRAAVAVLVVFAVLSPFARDLFSLLSGALTVHLPEGGTMIATHVAEPFLTPFKLAFVAAVFIAIPVVLYQVWMFIAPGLYAQERRLVVPLLASSTLLFYCGAAFAYYVVFPLVFRFFTSVVPEGVQMMTDMAAYLDFVLTLFFAFGLAFEVPVLAVLLVWAGLTTPAALRKKRPYVLVGAFVVGMFLTPPDVISQTLLAVPIYLLYEIGIFMARWFVPGSREVEAQRGER